MRETMTAKEAAELLGKSEWWTYEQARRGILPHIRVARTVLFRRQTILAWLDTQEQASIATEQGQGKIRKVNERRRQRKAVSSVERGSHAQKTGENASK